MNSFVLLVKFIVNHTFIHSWNFCWVKVTHVDNLKTPKRLTRNIFAHLMTADINRAIHIILLLSELLIRKKTRGTHHYNFQIYIERVGNLIYAWRRKNKYIYICVVILW